MNKVEKIRLSIGTASQLGLRIGELIPDFTSAFLMTYCETGCTANCAFCPQARESDSSPQMLSRISWPLIDFDVFLSAFGSFQTFTRVCIQCLNYDGVVEETIYIIKQLRTSFGGPISICVHPLKGSEIRELNDAGATNIGIAIDAATPAVFDRIKGKSRGSHYLWTDHERALFEAASVFGVGKVTTHLIVGLGETEREASEFLLDMFQRGIRVGLFAFTSVRGTSLEGQNQPDLGTYRRIQALRYLLERGEITADDVEYSDKGEIVITADQTKIREVLSSGQAFRVSGCSGCNRPYYNERPGGPLYNYPRPLSEDEVVLALEASDLVTQDG
ncbi:MAG: radical SAM protein [Candidatus Thorarchaeota archaeon]|jgi:biotin synthase